MESKLDPNELMAAIQQETNQAMGEALREQVTNKCFSMCVKPNSSSFSARDSTCVSNCMDRFVDAMNVVTEALAARQNRGF